MYPNKKNYNWEINDNARLTMSEVLSDLVTRFRLIRLLAWNSIRTRVRQSFFGLLWPISHPIVSALMFFIVFNKIAGIESGDVPYPLFVFIGSMVWSFVSSSNGASVSSIIWHTEVVCRTYFPRVVLPAAVCLASAFSLLISSLVLLSLMIWFEVPFTKSLFSLPIWLLFLGLLVFGYAMFFSMGNAYFRDFGQMSGFLNQVWMFLSPVAYPSNLVSDTWAPIYYLNPLAGILDGIRWAVVGSEFRWYGVISLVVTVGVFIAGLWMFSRYERTVADHL